VEVGRRRALPEGSGEEGGRGDGGGEGEEEADKATHGSWAGPGRSSSVSPAASVVVCFTFRRERNVHDYRNSIKDKLLYMIAEFIIMENMIDEPL
jgi:uncharacterized spore protein YtfJ